ncbi:MAG TPA: GDSL-type esterase/lipase family protein [Thermoleophilaceae bacterium]|nr:GDSL-type esterase/lipase family protein [Thermoleophilaceae bacterium]
MPPAHKLAITTTLAVALLGAAPAAAQVAAPALTMPEPAAPQQYQPLSFAAPSEGRAGRPLELVVRRRAAAEEYAAELCTAPPASGWSCRGLTLVSGTARIAPRVRVPAPGRWLFEVRNGEQRIRRSVRVRPRGGRLKVLATGDSMIQIVDGFLRDGLGRAASLRSDAQISTGISKPEMLDWIAKSRSQARRIRPDVTVVYLGANDGFSMATPSGAIAPCCGDAWIEEYARRAGRMMRAYARGSAGRVYWLTLPAPRGGPFRKVYGPVNAAVRRAARRTAGARVVPIDDVFTPGFRYRDTLMRDGRAVRVRQADGVHFNVTGASIVASEILARLRADRVL